MALYYISLLSLRDWGTSSRMNARRFALGIDTVIIRPSAIPLE